MRWNTKTDSLRTAPNNGRTAFLRAAKCWTPNDATDGCRRMQNTQNNNSGKVQGDTKKRELLKNPTKIEEIRQKKIIDRN